MGDVFVTVRRALLLGLLAALVLVPASLGGSSCANDVLADWRDDGRIDRVYPLPCYEDAIDAIPADLLPYADADEEIGRALQSALRERGVNAPRGPETPREPGDGPPPLPSPTPPVNTSAATALPLPLLVLGSLTVVLLTTGGLGWVARRRRHDDARTRAG